jgi:hypothetical protein
LEELQAVLARPEKPRRRDPLIKYDPMDFLTPEQKLAEALANANKIAHPKKPVRKGAAISHRRL